MTMIDNQGRKQEKVRVSIFERIVPFAAFALAAIAGGAGAFLIVELFNTLAAVENAGVAAIAGGLAEYMLVPLVLLYASVGLGIVGICVAIGRMVLATTTASPSGLSYLMLGLLSLVPAAIVYHSGTATIGVITNTTDSDPAMTGAAAGEWAVAAMMITPIVLLVLLACSLIPFRARPGRRFGPLIALVLMELVLITAAAMYQLRVAELWRINAAW
jgi:hypothetical protein